MLRALIQKEKDKFIGVILNVPEKLQFEGANQTSKTKRVFYDLNIFYNTVKELNKEKYFQDIPPYLDFIFKNYNETNQVKINWERIPEKTMEAMTEYQKDAIITAFEKHQGKSLIALGPGSGKTLIGSVLLHLYQSNFLVLCPANKCIDWQNEIAQWCEIPKPPILKSKKQSELPSCLIASMDMAKDNIFLMNQKFQVIIVDESHYLKNDSKRTLKISLLLKDTPVVIELSGTPIENTPIELYNQIHVLHPRVFNNRDVFISRYLECHENKWGRIEFQGPKKEHLEELNFLMNLIWYRRTDITAVNYSLIRKIIKVEATEKEDCNLLEEMKQKQSQLIIQHAQAQTSNDQEYFLLQIKQYVNKMWETSGLIKGKILSNEIEHLINIKHPEEKICFFVYHHAVARLMEKIIQPFGEYIQIDGSTSKEKRNKLTQEFRKISSGPKYGIMNIGAMGVGVNFSPGVSVVVFIELERNPSKMEQAEMRAYRFGALRDVTSYWYILENSNDSSTLEKLQKKREVNTVVMNGKRARFTHI